MGYLGGMEVNYLDVLANEIEQSLSADLRPKSNAKSLYRVYALLALVKGIDVTLENVHDAWSSWKTATEPDHESIRPFSELDKATREKDRPYVEVIHRIAERRGYIQSQD